MRALSSWSTAVLSSLTCLILEGCGGGTEDGGVGGTPGSGGAAGLTATGGALSRAGAEGAPETRGGSSGASTGSAGKSGASAGRGGSAATAGAGATAGIGASSSGGDAGRAAAGGPTGGAGSDAAGTGGVSGGGVITDCDEAPADTCPLATGLSYACKKRFALGINYAWRSFGADFGGLAQWDIPGVSADASAYAADLRAMRDHGVSVIRWWVFPDFRGDGIVFDAAGDPTGLSALATADMQKALELAAGADVYIVPTIFSFDAFRPTRTDEGVLIRGITPLVTDAARRAKLIQNVVRPLAEAAASSAHPERLIGWDFVNEPEWAIEPSGMNSQDFDPNPELDAVSLAEMKALFAQMGAALKEITPHAFTSVGWAAAKWSWAFGDVAVDVNQPHIYGWVNQYWPYTLKPGELGYPVRPTIMGEFYLTNMPFENSTTMAQILESFWTTGYAGAWPWQHFDEAASMPLIQTFAEAKGCQGSF